MRQQGGGGRFDDRHAGRIQPRASSQTATATRRFRGTLWSLSVESSTTGCVAAVSANDSASWAASAVEP
jgi:hypothetical protein